MSGVPWTKKEREILVELAKRGCRAREIKAVLKSRSMDSIHCQADNLGISLAGIPPEVDFDEFRRLLKQSTPH